MAAKRVTLKKRDFPVRTCVICREKNPKSEMTRFVSTEQGLLEGVTLPGRGFYLCGKEKCRSVFEKKWKVKR